jgi:phosphatidylinositol 4-kinase
MAPGDDLIMSNMYSLLNYVAATSKEIHDAPHNGPPLGLFSGLNGEYPLVQSDRATVHSVDTVTHGRTEEERRLITTSTISLVSRLALEFKRDEVSAVVSIKTIPAYNRPYRLLD